MFGSTTIIRLRAYAVQESASCTELHSERDYSSDTNQMTVPGEDDLLPFLELLPLLLLLLLPLWLWACDCHDCSFGYYISFIYNLACSAVSEGFVQTEPLQLPCSQGVCSLVRPQNVLLPQKYVHCLQDFYVEPGSWNLDPNPTRKRYPSFVTGSCKGSCNQLPRLSPQRR